VKAFASENATVVVGAVIDPDMSDELRVTVVATGIGAERKPDISLVHGHHRAAEPVRTQYNSHSASVYGNAGTVYGNAGNAAREMRDAMPAMAPVEAAQSKPQADNKANIDIFDIPAFLRKQAD
jgi:cell division protein FtsZ